MSKFKIVKRVKVVGRDGIDKVCIMVRDQCYCRAQRDLVLRGKMESCFEVRFYLRRVLVMY